MNISKSHLSKELLINLYINQDKSIDEISKMLGASKITISKWLKASNIDKSKEIPTFDVLNNLYVIQCKNINEIAEILKTNQYLVSKWLTDCGIKVRLFGEPPTKDVLSRLFLDEKLTVKQIAELYKTDKNVIQKWLNDFSLENDKRKFYHLRAIPLIDQQREFIVGTLLGTGSLQRVGKKKSIKLVVNHYERHLDYLLYKKELMKPYINVINKRDSKWSWNTMNLNDLKFYYKLFYDNNKKIIKEEIGKYLTPFGMAILIMDKGWRKGQSIRLSSQDFTKEENEILARIIKINFDVRCKVCEYTRNNKKYYYLSCNKESSFKLTNIIAPYTFPAMKYKLVSD